jgi:hypothetical protein
MASVNVANIEETAGAAGAVVIVMFLLNLSESFFLNQTKHGVTKHRNTQPNLFFFELHSQEKKICRRLPIHSTFLKKKANRRKKKAGFNIYPFLQACRVSAFRASSRSLQVWRQLC